VAEEKLDGANAGISFTGGGELRLQSRGHYLTGGPRERQFGPFKSWVARSPASSGRCWASATCSTASGSTPSTQCFYDALPHYFCEFDVLDRNTGAFLSTPRRHELLAGTPVVSVPVLRAGEFGSLDELTALIGPSTCRTANTGGTRWPARRPRPGCRPTGRRPRPTRPTRWRGCTSRSRRAAGVVERYKWVRAGFLQALLDSGSHWADRPLIANRLADPGVLYAGL